MKLGELVRQMERLGSYTDHDPDVVMIGACSWDPPQEAPGWLEDIARPVVLVTTSSEFQDDGVLVRTALVVSDAETFGQSIMLQAPHSLVFGVLTRVRWFFGHGLDQLRRVDDARTIFVPHEDVMLTKRGAREP